MLTKLTYSEFEGDPRSWTFGPCDFVEHNLVVGRNATGKTRLINVINGLCQLISGKRAALFLSGTYSAEVNIGNQYYCLYLSFKDNEVVSENLTVNGEERLSRNENGEGNLYYEGEDKFLSFKIPKNVLALQTRRDALQHSYIAKLGDWAQSCQQFKFGSSLGHDKLLTVQALRDNGNLELDKHVVSVYLKGYEKYKKRLDKGVLRDMAYIGYELSEVGVGDTQSLSPHLNLNLPDTALCLFASEADRKKSRISQLDMSQGMFRALAIVISLNLAVLSKFEGLVLIDDIGEGLDYDRSTKLIELIRMRLRGGVQTVLTTNDRFVMNVVPLDNWCLLRRVGDHVQAITQRSHPSDFENFKFAGLSNFEFFKSELIEGHQ
ncbi:AAA family ATPase [Pseudorhodoferax sp.]|uniref:AAA family ATPase n=1 Tax=Pseudorhodoferax sp. TaxID=1993553 RepID=UPI002DD63C1C|nr:AAA family ATPase [Pseudorhodoferax sp.]